MVSYNNSGKRYRLASGLVLYYFGPNASRRTEYLEGWYFQEENEFAFTVSSKDPIIFVSMDSFNELSRIQKELVSWVSREEFERLPPGLQKILTTKDPKMFNILPLI